MKLIEDKISVNDFYKIVKQNVRIELSNSLKDRVENSYHFLKKFAKDKIIYGVNTGFGPMAQYKIQKEDRLQLQINLIRSHSSGSGTPIKKEFSKAAVLARLNTLSLGYSGVHSSVTELMKEFINRDIIPVIFEHGGVGASGDLVQLAHIALALMGEGEVFYKDERRFTKDVFEIENLEPIKIKLREGLALMNGTSVMTGIGMMNIIESNKLLDWSVKFSCTINEIVKAYDDHFSFVLNNTKLHKGQSSIAEKMRGYLSDSKLIRKREDHLYKGETNHEVFEEKVQEYYSLRCVPQIIGPIFDTIEKTTEVLENEVNSANDNPIVDTKTEHVYHGGNFHGDYISLEMDKLKIAITRLSMLAERQLNYLLNSKINEIFTPFVNLGKLGFNFGMQGVQFTAVSTTAENQMLSNSMYVHSIPNNNDNQDIVSMGTNAALITAKVIENTYEVFAIQAITIIQAIEYLQCQKELSAMSKDLYDELRTIVPAFKEDIVMYPYLQLVKDFLKK